MAAQRYSFHKNRGIRWTMFDVVTGQPVVIDGVVMDTLTAEEADDLVDLLNRKADVEWPSKLDPEAET